MEKVCVKEEYFEKESVWRLWHEYAFYKKMKSRSTLNHNVRELLDTIAVQYVMERYGYSKTLC
jgi:hypothetical protein